MKAEYDGEKHNVQVTNEKGATSHDFMLKSDDIKPESNHKLRTQTDKPDLELKPELDSDDGMEQKIRYLEKELKKSKKEISDAKLHIKQLKNSLKRSENRIKKVESQNYGLKLQIPYYEQELKFCVRNRTGKNSRFNIEPNQPYTIEIACKNDFTREKNGKFSNVQRKVIL